MDKTIGVGYENFEELIHDGNYYVDKTELLYELAVRTKNKVTLFTRPRRFGKTLTMRMLESFFDVKRDSGEVFRGMDILVNHPEFCSEWMNQYPVLFITLKDVEGYSYDLAYEKLEAVIADLCKAHMSLMESDRVDTDDRDVFLRLKARAATETDIQNSLKTIMRMMQAVYGKPVILLVDEYDVPLAKAQATKDRKFYHRMLDTLRGLMSISLKTNDFLKFAVITGCLRISKESIFTGVNNFACYSVTSKRFSSHFGFLRSEVEQMLAAFDMQERLGVIKEWYDGYVFGSNDVFCPWDVVSYLASVVGGGEEEPRNYWANTSSNAILDEFVNHSDFDASEKFEILLNGGTIVQEISEELTYDRISESETNFWSVLLMTGYVSKADKSGAGRRVRLRIPNMEVAELFRDAVVARFSRRLDASRADDFVEAMWRGDEDAASASLTDILWDSISYFDYGEDYYHGMLNGIFASRGLQPESNDEAGLGRLDLRVKDRPNRRLLLLEFKRSKAEADLDADCDVAIEQVMRKGYAKTMPYGYRTQLVYGIAFFGKIAKVKLCRAV